MAKSGSERRTRGCLWAVLGVSIVAIALIVVALRGRHEESGPPSEGKPVPVRVLALRTSTIEDTLKLPGRIEAAIDLTMSSESGGRIVETPAEKGASVTNGEILVVIDQRFAAGMLKRAQVENREATKSMTRWSALRSTGAVADSDYDAIRERYDLSEVALTDARTALEKCIVRSPVNGRLERRTLDVGEYINDGVPLCRVVNTDTVKVIVDVPEREIANVMEDQQISFNVLSLDGNAFTGTVSLVTSAAERGQSSFRTEITVSNAGGRLRPGMLADVDLVRPGREGAILVPLAAVIPQRGEHVVFVRDGETAVRRTVQILSLSGREATVTGVEAGEEVIVEGHRALQDGVRIAVVDEPGAVEGAAE